MVGATVLLVVAAAVPWFSERLRFVGIDRWLNNMRQLLPRPSRSKLRMDDDSDTGAKRASAPRELTKIFSLSASTRGFGLVHRDRAAF